ncbi:MAG TPA: 23S rRNA (uracil(1939)-C(5))-methyltransferase RlmD [Solirubrobacteraceae bacterium]|jgi:23S rRNA (uracil1939-C5)-methyltransferase
MSDEPTTTASTTGAVRARRPERGERIELTIDSLAYGGEGVARYGEEGYVVFVAGAIPGDRVQALVYKRKRAYAHARALEILEAGPERIEPRAEHPGVPWQVLPYERQLEVKRDQIDEALRRIGHLDGYRLDPIVPAVQEWRYRNKLEYSFGQGPNGELLCGFHAPAGWNKVIQIEDCLLASELGNRARMTALAWARAQGLTAWERAASPRGERLEQHERTGPAADGRARLRNLVVREGRRTGRLQLRLVSTPGELDVETLAQELAAELGIETLSGLLWTRSASLAESTGGGETELVWGEEQLPERLGELDLRISPEAFFQTNTEMAEVLYGIVAEHAALSGFERVYDLYCGTGTIGLSLAPRAGELWGVDIVPEAIADAIAAAARNGVDGAQFFAGDTRLALPELLERAGRPDLVVVDPPRAGLSQRIVRRIIEAAPKRIVYVSCNPTTLAPNAAQLVEAGWRLNAVTPVDMFPQTHHVECVAQLDRGR